MAVALQAYWCDITCYWRTVATGSGLYYQGGGSGKWANARVYCNPTNAPIGYRAYTDVDIVGINDPSGVHYTAAFNFYCAPG